VTFAEIRQEYYESPGPLSKSEAQVVFEETERLRAILGNVALAIGADRSEQFRNFIHFNE
jgi:hypothetical protein